MPIRAHRGRRTPRYLPGALARLIAGGAFAAATASPGFAADPLAERYVPPIAGTAYTVVQHDRGSFGVGETQMAFTVAAREWRGRRVFALESKQETMLMTPEGGLVAVLSHTTNQAAHQDKPAAAYWDPPFGFDWPLSVGKSWTRSYRITDANNWTSPPFDYACKVDGYEELKTPGGAFNAFKISCSTPGAADTLWFSPDLGLVVKQRNWRGGTHHLGAGTRETELAALDRKAAGSASPRSKADQLVAEGATRLSAEELKQILTGTEISGEDFSGRAFALRFRDGGSVVGITNLPGRGVASVSGTWSLNDKGQFCSMIRFPLVTAAGSEAGCEEWLRAGSDFYAVRERDVRKRSVKKL